MERRHLPSKALLAAGALASWSGALCGCDGTQPSADGCALTQPLLSGTSHAEYIGLSDAEENAVLELDFRIPGGTETCTGTLITGDWILTAAHCTHGSAESKATISIGPSSARPIRTLESSRLVRHSTLDLLLVGVDAHDTVDLSPIRAEFVDGRTLQAGKAQIAGFGLDDDRKIGSRLFSVERFAQIDDEALSVDGSEFGGPCTGDSGGPLLAVDDRGAPALVGVLAAGSAGCRGLDTYTRLTYDVLDWLAMNGANVSTNAETQDCGAIDQVGRCFGNRAVWCSGGTRSVDVCTENCGWDDSSAGYRCVSMQEDPCRGVPREGVCKGNVAAYCSAGVVERYDCGICGHGCVLSPTSGGAACLR